MTATGASPIPADRAFGLFRWNAVLAVLHFVQFAAILALSFAKSPVVTSPAGTAHRARTPLWKPARRCRRRQPRGTGWTTLLPSPASTPCQHPLDRPRPSPHRTR